VGRFKYSPKQRKPPLSGFFCGRTSFFFSSIAKEKRSKKEKG
jgi:hypothetical protein